MERSSEHEKIVEYAEEIEFGSTITVVSLILKRLLDSLTAWLLTGHLTTSNYGLFAFMQRLVNLMVKINSSLQIVSNRFIPGSEEELKTIYMGEIAKYGFILSLTLSGVIYILSEPITVLSGYKESLIPILRIGAFIVIPLSLIQILSGFFRSYELPVAANLARRILIPISIFLGASAAVFSSLKLFEVAGAVLASSTVALVFCGIYFARTKVSTPKLYSNSKNLSPELKKYTIEVLASSTGFQLQFGGFFLIAAFTLSSYSMGLFSIAILISGFAIWPIIAVNELTEPISSKLYKNGHRKALAQLNRITARFAFYTSVFIFLVILSHGRFILEMFDSSYSSGFLVLAVLSFSSVMDNFFGSVGTLMKMTDYPKAHLKINIVMTLLGLTSGYFLASKYGVIGLSIAFSATQILNNLLEQVVLKVLEGIWIPNISYWKPAASGLLALASMQIIPLKHGTTVSILLGVLLGLLIYIVALKLLGTKEIDREVFYKLIADIENSL